MLMLYLSLIDDPGDRRKFEELYKKYRQTMYYTAYRILQNVDDAEDVVQTAFLRIINHLDDIDENDEPKTKSYVSIITQNLALDVYRKKKRDWEASFSYDEFQRCSFKSKSLSDLIFNVSCIGKMHKFFIIYKNNKGRRFHRCLGNVIKAESLSFIGRRLLHGNRFCHNFI